MSSLTPVPTKVTVLIVEDEFLIAMDLIDLLERAGYEIIGPASTTAAALDLLSTHLPDACVLDVNLRGEHSASVAARLKVKNVPFVLSSAYDAETLDHHEEFRGVTNVGKPAPAHLPSLITALLKADDR